MTSSSKALRQPLDSAGLQVFEAPQSVLIIDMMKDGVKVLKERRNQFRPIQRTELGSLFDQFGDLRHGCRIIGFRELRKCLFHRAKQACKPTSKILIQQSLIVNQMRRWNNQEIAKFGNSLNLWTYNKSARPLMRTGRRRAPQWPGSRSKWPGTGQLQNSQWPSRT